MTRTTPAPIPSHTSTLIIGGGPSGIVSLKYSLEYDQDPTSPPPVLIEQEGDIGGTFRYRGYGNAELVSSKQLTSFSDYRYPLSAPDHPSLPNFVKYLHDYAESNGLSPHILLRTKVISLQLVPDAKIGDYRHRATIQQEDGTESTILSKKVIITTGLHVTPNIPLIPGLNTTPYPSTPIPYIHSSFYKSRSQLTDKKILVLGAGETAMDIAYESILSPAKSVHMGIRSGFLSFPKVLNNFRVLGSTFDGNLPIDGLITNLFETTKVHPWVAASHLRWFISDYMVKKVLWVLTGTTAGCAQFAGELPKERQGRAFVFLNKSAKAMQFINQPYVNISPLHRLFAHYIDPPIPSSLVKNGEKPTIHLTPFPSSFDSDGRAVFPNPPEHRKKEVGWKVECKPDLVVLCTGYTQKWDWLGEGYPRGPRECDLRGVVCSRDTSVGFIGFLRPGVGAIPPMAEMQAQFFLLISQNRIAKPTTPETYHLLHSPTGRIQYGVDYSTYMATLARDMGSSPGLRELIREYGLFVCFVYCFGAAFPTFYRLVGPYKSKKAVGIVKTELYETIQRRGIIGNIFMGVIPMAFYALVNLVALILEVVWVFGGPLFGYRTRGSWESPDASLKSI